MRQCEFKKRYNPNSDIHERIHIYGEGIGDIFKSIGSKLFGKTAKKIAKTAVTKAATEAATKTGEYAGKKAGDKIVELLSRQKKQPNLQTVTKTQSIKTEPKELTQREVHERVNQILSGGKLRRRNFI